MYMGFVILQNIRVEELIGLSLRDRISRLNFAFYVDLSFVFYILTNINIRDTMKETLINIDI